MTVTCTKCKKTFTATPPRVDGVPGVDYHSERRKTEPVVVTCPHCGHSFTVEVSRK